MQLPSNRLTALNLIQASIRALIQAVAVGLLAGGAACAEGPAPFMMRTSVEGNWLEGQPLRWTDSQMLLLGRDGALYEFDPKLAKKAKKTAKRFVSYSSSEMAALLQQEFDRSYEVSTTQHFVVVHPRGPWGAWAVRLESLYRSFTHYMSVRGFSVKAPATPLVAIVFRNQADYYRHAAAGGTPLAAGTLGHYAPLSNRIFLYDISESSGDAEWLANAETIIHEATHQTAFNTGVHARFAEQPRWLVEGLAMMFEAPGVWNASSLQGQETRLNRGRLADFRRQSDRRPEDWLLRTVASDAEFTRDGAGAYANAWTLSFYLCETRPQEYTRYLSRVAARKPFTKYPAKQRLADFIGVFGSDLTLLDAQLQRFVSELP